MAVRIRTDAGRCIGSGHCARLAPEFFDQDDELGTVVLRPGLAAAEVALTARLAEVRDTCPVSAIAFAAGRKEQQV
ncbi:ferredoxin [Nocardia sp. NPDC050697]|uniref:ferredoxin n=1 Tax=Nocardia sp. NPDC050697 TaxID=3155158 RepID=UPI0033E06798